MGANTPPSPNRPAPPGSSGGDPVSRGGGSAQGLPGTRAAPTGKQTERAHRFAAGFLQRNPGAATLAAQMYPTAPAAPEDDVSDIGPTEALMLYERLRNVADPQTQLRMDEIADRIRNGER